MTIRFSLMLALALAAGCASDGYLSAGEIAPGKSISQLKRLGWDIDDPTTVDSIERDPKLNRTFSGGDWDQFKLLIQPGDELREVMYKVEYGVAIFRHGTYVASYLPVVVMR